MKNLPLVVGIPLAVVLILVGSVFAWRLGQSAVKSPAGGYMAEEDVSLQDSASAPESSFGGQATSTNPDVAGMESDLASTVDDGGASDLDSLTKDAEGL